jgi:excisionase family DNA binding protein
MTTRLAHGVPELAAELGVSDEWVRQQCRDGRFPHHRVGRRIRFSDEDLAAIVADMAVPAATRPRPATQPPLAGRRYPRADVPAGPYHDVQLPAQR